MTRIENNAFEDVGRNVPQSLPDINNFKKRKSSFPKLWCGMLIGASIIGTLLLIVWSSGYLVPHRKESVTFHRSAERLTAPKQPIDFKDQEEHKDDGSENIEEDDTSGMLPKYVKPHHYNLTLQVFLPPEGNFTTKGNVLIAIECLRETKVIIMHALEMKVNEVSVSAIDDDSENATQYKTKVSMNAERQLLLIHLDQPLQSKTHYNVDIGYEGHINNRSVGLYRSSYKTESGNTSWVASSQFQPTDARRAFPCFDEPGLKATYEVKIIRRPGTVSLSNMPSWKTEAWGDNWELVTYNTTPVMSSYLLALVIGDIMPYKNVTNQGVQVWSRPSMVQHGDYAYSISPKILKFYGGYFSVPYTMPKTDLVAVPNFLHAAMENWGLVIFEESALLHDPERSSTANKVLVTLVIAHELAHQWFGNLVTPVWWNNLWLNEGFATYYEYLGIHAVQPEWNISHHFISTIYEAMETDSLTSSRAMSAPAHPKEIMELFDDISYLKGGAIIRMLQHILGEESFRKGLTNYLKKYSFKSTTENDLWQNLNLWNKGRIGVKEIMETWTSQAGYPVVNIQRFYDNGSALLTQEFYNINRGEINLLKTNAAAKERFWAIPVSYTNGAELDWSPDTDVWLSTKSVTIDELPDEDTWIIGNVQQVGYYRVNYDTQNWELLFSQLMENHEAIHVINRAQLINDALNLARSENMEYSLALNMTKYLYQEKEFLPWQAAFSAFKHIDFMLAKTQAYGAWKDYMLQLMSPLYKSLGWTESSENENVLIKFLRKTILKWSCTYGDDDCIDTALTMFRSWKNSTDENVTIPVDVREVALCTGVARGRTKDWKLVWKRYLKEDFKEEKNILLRSLTCTREPWLLERLLHLSLNYDSGIPLQDGSEVFVHVAENVYGRDLAYNFFKRNWDEIAFRYGSFAFAKADIVDHATAPLNTEYEVQELQGFLKRRKDDQSSGLNTALHHAIHRSQANISNT